MFKRLLIAAAALFWVTAAHAQCSVYPLYYGQVLTPAQWNCLLGYGINAVPLSGGTMTGELTTAPASTSSSGFNITPGAAPTSPLNGDTWVTAAGMFQYINGAVWGPYVPLIATGSPPTLTGTCTTGTKVGGNIRGTFQATCSNQTIIMAFATTAPNGWVCNTVDRTTSADTVRQVSSTATSATLNGTTNTNDVIQFSCFAY